MFVGYMRVSTHEQTTDLQMDALIRAGVAPDWIYSDTGSGTRKDLPGWSDCNKVLRQGDTLIVWRLDRLGRSLQHLVGIVEDLTKRDVGLRILEGQGRACSSPGSWSHGRTSKVTHANPGFGAGRSHEGQKCQA